MSEEKIIDPNTYDPVKISPFSFQERCIFNTAVGFVTILSLLCFIFPLLISLSFPGLAAGFICAAPGLIVLCGFFQGRAKRKVRTFHTCVFISELVFLLYMVLYCASALKSPEVGDPIIPCIVAVTLFLIYVMCLEIGILRLVKRHEDAYYDEKLKSKLPY